MHRNKRYTNATFTKRVDHAGGEHRGPKAIPEPALCEDCGAVRIGRRWTRATARHPRASADAVVPRRVVCPACQQASEGEPRGFVTLTGGFLNAHRSDLERLITNEARRAGEDNPLARILAERWDGATKLTVTTTTEHLALRLGRVLESAFGGDVTFDFSHENKLARVGWRRD